MTAIRAWPTRGAWQAEEPRIIEQELAALASARAATQLSGVCALCGTERGFAADVVMHGPREGLACSHCGCNARQRAAAAVLLDALAAPAAARVYATEQGSRFHVALRPRLGRLLGSEFRPSLQRRLRLSLWLLRRGVPAWVRDEDVTALRLRDAAFDGVVSLDVLEHVPDYRTALREFARVLRPGGVLVLTVPFYDDAADNVQIARLGPDGAVEHLGAPEFHGDPLRGGVVCFHHFGWALLDAMREAGFAQVDACRVQGMTSGLPQGLWVLRARL